MKDRRRADRVAEEPRPHAARAASRDLLHRDDPHEAVAFDAAVALGIAELHIANCGSLLIELARELAGLVPSVRVRLDLAGDEPAQRLPERLMLGRVEWARPNGVERMRGHGPISFAFGERLRARRASSGEAMARPASRAAATSAF